MTANEQNIFILITMLRKVVRNTTIYDFTYPSSPHPFSHHAGLLVSLATHVHKLGFRRYETLKVNVKIDADGYKTADTIGEYAAII